MARTAGSRMMLRNEIPAFVEAIIETGCDICAVGHDLYTLGDADLPWDELEIAAPKIAAISERFGDRDFLRLEIVAHLRSLGRYLDRGDIQHWSENTPTQ